MLLRFLILSAVLLATAFADEAEKKPAYVTQPPPPTTYNYQQHTNQGTYGPGYDWGQHTGAHGQGTTYNYQQHTNSGTYGPGYDWGQHTGAQGQGTTYNYQQHTSTYGPGYDWGKHTPPPNGNGNDNGNGNENNNHTTGNNGDHGQTVTTEMSNGNNDHNNNNNNNNNNNDEEHGDRPNYRCGSGTYTCAGTVNLCLKLNKICDGHINCPHADDEDHQICSTGRFRPSGNSVGRRGHNGFRGTGFMFHVGKMHIKNKSQARLFNQNSDSTSIVRDSQK